MTILVQLLVVILGASILSFLVMGMSQWLRMRHLARFAHEAGMRFFATDAFDVPHRYGALSVMHGGHSPAAHNVVFGRRQGLPLRIFDFRYEVGHGTRRSTRRYLLAVVELERSCRPVLMWNTVDSETCPLAAQAQERLVGCWSCKGDDAASAVMAELMSPLASQGVSLEAGGGLLALHLPNSRRTRHVAALMDMAIAAAGVLQGRQSDQLAGRALEQAGANGAIQS